MTITKVAVVTLACMFFLACSDFIVVPPDCTEILEDARRETAIDLRPISIVLCDYSSSMDTISMQKVKSKASDLYSDGYNKSDWRFYKIEGESRGPFFITEMIPTSALKGGSDRLNMVNNCINSGKDSIHDALQKALQAASTSHSSDTYIIQSLETSINWINEYDTAHKYHHTIYILSDMLESGTSSFGKIDIEDGISVESNRRIEDRADNADVYSYIHNNIKIEVTLLSQKAADLFQLTAFWNLVFKKLGSKERVYLTN